MAGQCPLRHTETLSIVSRDIHSHYLTAHGLSISCLNKLLWIHTMHVRIPAVPREILYAKVMLKFIYLNVMTGTRPIQRCSSKSGW